jgi:ASC-1-like (ASCH) protein
MTEYTKNLSEPWFSLIKLGIKKCEGRLKKGDFAEIKKGDYIKFENNEFGFERNFRVIITSIHNYNSFEEYLLNETLENCLPGIDTIEQGVSVYYKYYKKDDEDRYKIIAIRLKIC